MPPAREIRNINRAYDPYVMGQDKSVKTNSFAFPTKNCRKFAEIHVKNEFFKKFLEHNEKLEILNENQSV